jgi:hypothetical protein
LAANWDINWQPSKYDEAQVSAGVVTVTTVGQHVGVLRLATNAGDHAEMNISGGWLQASTGIVIGNTPTSQGVLRLSGGELSTPVLMKGAVGQFAFTGGKLHADIVAFDLVNQGGVLAPGDTFGGMDATNTYVAGPHIGLTHVMGNLKLESGSVEIELAAGGLNDSLVIDALLTLGGNLDVEFLNGFQPQVGERWLIASANDITGNFSSITDGFTVDQQGGNLYLVSAVPEPSTVCLMMLGGVGLAAGTYRRSRRRGASS